MDKKALLLPAIIIVSLALIALMAVAFAYDPMKYIYYFFALWFVVITAAGLMTVLGVGFEITNPVFDVKAVEKLIPPVEWTIIGTLLSAGLAGVNFMAAYDDGLTNDWRVASFSLNTLLLLMIDGYTYYALGEK